MATEKSQYEESTPLIDREIYNLDTRWLMWIIQTTYITRSNDMVCTLYSAQHFYIEMVVYAVLKRYMTDYETGEDQSQNHLWHTSMQYQRDDQITIIYCYTRSRPIYRRQNYCVANRPFNTSTTKALYVIWISSTSLVVDSAEISILSHYIAAKLVSNVWPVPNSNNSVVVKTRLIHGS